MDTVAQICEQLGIGRSGQSLSGTPRVGRQRRCRGRTRQRSDRKALAAELAAQLIATEAKDDKKKDVKLAFRLRRATRSAAHWPTWVVMPRCRRWLRQLPTSTSARWPAFALDRIPTLPAATALAEAAQKSVGVEFRAGLTGALAKRPGSVAVEALKQACGERTPAATCVSPPPRHWPSSPIPPAMRSSCRWPRTWERRTRARRSDERGSAATRQHSGSCRAEGRGTRHLSGDGGRRCGRVAKEGPHKRPSRSSGKVTVITPFGRSGTQNLACGILSGTGSLTYKILTIRYCCRVSRRCQEPLPASSAGRTSPVRRSMSDRAATEGS